MATDKTIRVWKFEDAPDKYRKITMDDSDADWLAFIPNSIKNDDIYWMYPGTSFGSCSVDEYKVKGGVIRIGFHS